jgi:hypothetical protein
LIIEIVIGGRREIAVHWKKSVSVNHCLKSLLSYLHWRKMLLISDLDLYLLGCGVQWRV